MNATAGRDDRENAGEPTTIDRRTAVAAGTSALVGLGLLCAGCSSPSTSTESGSTAAAAPGTTLGKAADVPVGGGTVYSAAKVVVTQQTAGKYVGLSAVCPHQGCLVTQVSGGMINCPCHGSQFGLDGSVAKGPATKPLAAQAVTVTNGDLTLG